MLIFWLRTAISVWCEVAAANFGEVQIPANLTGVVSSDAGPELKCSTEKISLGPLMTREHGVAGDVFLLSESVFEVTVGFPCRRKPTIRLVLTYAYIAYVGSSHRGFRMMVRHPALTFGLTLVSRPTTERACSRIRRLARAARRHSLLPTET